MKALAYILGSILLASGLGFIAYRDCGNLSYQSAITLMVDVTERDFLAQPEGSPVSNIHGVSHSIWDGFHFRLTTISDVEINPIIEAYLEPECQYTSNVFQRKKRVKGFEEKVKNAIEKSEQLASERKQSYIISPLMAEINQLAKIKAKQKVLIVHSDLFELSPLMNLYDKKQLKMLKEHPETIIGKIQSQFEIPDLTGIEIRLIFQPKNSAESEKYSVISKFFKKFFESRGATVEISANLNNLSP